jgi:ADP-heptose:LPS heptosyltransferase
MIMQSSDIIQKLNEKSIKNVKRINPKLKKLLVTIINKTGKILFLLKRNKLPVSPEKILFVSLYFNGDILFQSALFSLVNKLYPEAELHIWVKSRTKEMMKGYPDITKVSVFNDVRTRRYDEDVKFNLSDKIKFFRELRQEKYDMIFDLTGLFWTAFAVFFASPGYSSGFNFQGFGFIYNFETESIYNGHLIDKHMNIILKNPLFKEKLSHLDKIDTTPVYTISDESVENINELFKLHNITTDSKKIILHTTAGWAAKKWDIEKFISLIELLNHKFDIIIIGGPEDTDNAKIINYHIKSKIYNFTGKLSINESAEVIRRADFYIGADSGPLYLAEAVGTPTLSLFGPTNPLFSSPRGEKHTFIYKRLFCSADENEQNCKLMAGLNCRTIDCMKLISPEEAAGIIIKHIK